jgi:TPR repeat protein
MRRSNYLTVVAVFMFASTAAWGADLQKGLDAYAVGDYATAMAECLPLAEAGDAEAMFCVGQMYANGFGVDLDDAMALHWLGLAAGNGHAEAQYTLGVMHANGWGVAMNDVPAAGFYRLAAEQGFLKAQTALGFSYKHGAGVDRDLERAYMWFDIAAQQGDLIAESERDDLAPSMAEDEIFAARRSALQWLEGHEASAMHAGTID